MQLGSHGYRDALHVVAEDCVGNDGEREAEQLVVALDAGALGHTILLGVHRLLVAALDIGEGVLVVGREALEVLLGLLQVVCREGVFAAAHQSQHMHGTRCWEKYPTNVSASKVERWS